MQRDGELNIGLRHNVTVISIIKSVNSFQPQAMNSGEK